MKRGALEVQRLLETEEVGSSDFRLKPPLTQ